MQTIRINRAPVMTLWAVVVAERLGYAHDEALTLGRAVTGLNAYSKAKAIGLVSAAEPEPSERKPMSPPATRAQAVGLLGREVPVVRTKCGVRALAKDVAIDPASVERYLESKFKDALPRFRAAMRKLAGSRSPRDLALEAYALYEEFRPKIPAGAAGWGKAGVLSIATIEGLAPWRPGGPTTRTPAAGDPRGSQRS
jgi:hypothetical protein